MYSTYIEKKEKEKKTLPPSSFPFPLQKIHLFLRFLFFLFFTTFFFVVPPQLVISKVFIRYEIILKKNKQSKQLLCNQLLMCYIQFHDMYVYTSTRTSTYICRYIVMYVLYILVHYIINTQLMPTTSKDFAPFPPPPSVVHSPPPTQPPPPPVEKKNQKPKIKNQKSKLK